MFTQFNEQILRHERPTPRVIEGWPPPQGHPPPRRRVRPRAALGLAKLARRIDDRAAWRAFAP